MTTALWSADKRVSLPLFSRDRSLPPTASRERDQTTWLSCAEEDHLVVGRVCVSDSSRSEGWSQDGGSGQSCSYLQPDVVSRLFARDRPQIPTFHQTWWTSFLQGPPHHLWNILFWPEGEFKIFISTFQLLSCFFKKYLCFIMVPSSFASFSFSSLFICLIWFSPDSGCTR